MNDDIINKVNEKIKNKNIDCLIFDLDGTLFDTGMANEESYNSAFNDTGILFDRQAYKRAFGLRFNEMIEVVSPGLSDEKKKIIKNLKAIYYQKNINLVIPNKSLIELLKEVVRENDDIIICLATTASQKNAELVLEYFEINKYFDYILYGEDIKNSKPNSECYDRCINKFSLNPKRVLIFEDSEVGLIAAKKSGANYIKVKV